jgi:poly(3-hydroxybutyrate) depolymerase
MRTQRPMIEAHSIPPLQVEKKHYRPFVRSLLSAYCSIVDPRKIAHAYKIVTTISSTYNVDSSRIYACGKSKGGDVAALFRLSSWHFLNLCCICTSLPSTVPRHIRVPQLLTSLPVPILQPDGVADIATPFHSRTPKGASLA